MKYWIGVTDNHWFEFLAARRPDEVNFWRPSAGFSFRALEPGGLFLFRLHSPKPVIAGGGFYVRDSILPLSIAWEAFGEKNGAADIFELRQRIARHHQLGIRMEADPLIGCTVLTSPFFFREDERITVPPDWSNNIVRGKTYDMEEPIGKRLWQEVRERLQSQPDALAPADSRENGVAEETPRYSEFLGRIRLGQGGFRVSVTEAYLRRCAITGEKTLPVLQAAHIKPYSESGPHRVDNGLLLRSDLHILFDAGLLTVTRDLKVEVSKRIKEKYENGRDYYAFHGKPLAIVPRNPREQPAVEFLDYHNEHNFAQ